MKQLDHQNIIKFIDFIQTPREYYLIMEYIGSSNLFDYTCSKENYIIPEEDAKPIFKKVVLAVQECHRVGICHRDIKMENVLVNKRSEVKLIDFGFSQENGLLENFCGTPSYMAPEIVAKRSYEGAPADVWALGVMLYRMLSGIFPFKGSQQIKPREKQ